MGQCVSQPPKPRQEPRRRAAVTVLRDSVSRRAQRFTDRYRKSQENRRQPQQHQEHASCPPEGQLSGVPVAVDESEPHTSIERGSHAITYPSQDMPSHLLEAPRPRQPQYDQAYEQEPDVESYRDEDAPKVEQKDEFPEEIDIDRFRNQWEELLKRQLSAKDKEIFYNVAFKPVSTRVPPEAKKVEGKTLEINIPIEQSVYATEVDHFHDGSTSEYQPLLFDKAMAFAPQIVEENELELGESLGHGRFGQVHLAFWHGAEVAVKRFYSKDKSEAEKSQKQETKTLSMLKHPNVVTFFGTSTIRGNPAIVLEYVKGRSLRQQLLRLKRQGTASFKTKVKLALQAAHAMEYLHSRKIVHFDVKADNFLCDMQDPNKPIVKVADVGLSKHKVRSVVDGSLRGTLPWMAPELFPPIQTIATVNRVESSRGVDAKVDVYSFGIVMWEIWTLGSEPYGDKNAREVFFLILQGTLRPDIPAGVDQEWKRLMEKCWSNDPHHRPSFDNLAWEFKNILRKMPSDEPRR